MRNTVVAALVMFTTAAGCSSMDAGSKKAAVEPEHPSVVVQGIDGTSISGQLLNGSVTVDSGQGELTLLTDHVHSITLGQDADKLDSDSIKVTGKVKDTRFLVRNEHGVFTLSKDRLRKIDFVSNPATSQVTALSGSASGVTTIRAAGAAPTLTGH